MKRILIALLALVLAFSPALADGSEADYFHSSKGYSIALPEGWTSINLSGASPSSEKPSANLDGFISTEGAVLELTVLSAPDMTTRDLSTLDGRMLEYLLSLGCEEAVAGIYETHGEHEFYCCSGNLMGIIPLLRYAAVIDGSFFLLDFTNASAEAAASMLASLKVDR